MSPLQVEDELAAALAEVSRLLIVLDETHKEVAKNSMQHRTKAQQIHNARKKLFPRNFRSGVCLDSHHTSLQT